jgi:uncharacterized protein
MIIDFHTHIFPTFFSGNREGFFDREPGFRALYTNPKAGLTDREGLLKAMDKEGIHKAVVFGFPWEEKANFQRHNDYILESAALYPDRLIGFCCFSLLAPDSPQEARRCLRSGIAGVGEIAVYHDRFPPMDDRTLQEVLTLCSDWDVPILFHVNEPVGRLYPGKTRMDLALIYQLIQNHPSNRVILAHWGGGLPFYALLKKEVKEVFRNTWFDTAASPFLYDPAIYRMAGEAIGFEKILFGSDYPLLPQGRYIEEMASSGIAKGSLEKMLGLNALEVLRKTAGT